MLSSLKFGFYEFLEDRRGLRKLREACRKKFLLVAPLKNCVVTSYDKKTKKTLTTKNNDYFTVSVQEDPLKI